MKVHNPLPENVDITCTKASSILEHFIKGTNEIDQKLIPTNVLKQAYGIAIITMVKAGCLWSGRAGSGLVISRLDDGSWSAPSCICAIGVGVGAQFGAQITDVVFVLNSRSAVRAFTNGNFALGGNLSVATGPTGRSTEGNFALLNTSSIYSYSKSKGLFVGLTFEGTLILTRKKANKKMYGKVSAQEILSGTIPPPANAESLYRMLNLKFGALPFGKAMGSDLTLNGPVFTPYEPVHTQVTGFSKQSVSAPVLVPKVKSAPPKPPKKVKPCVALYDFRGEQPGDLSFQKGDVIYISSKNGDWYEGTCQGEKGIFPATYVSA
jgi:SH3 domain-containing YSC84-like protein 1